MAKASIEELKQSMRACSTQITKQKTEQQRLTTSIASTNASQQQLLPQQRQETQKLKDNSQVLESIKKAQTLVQTQIDENKTISKQLQDYIDEYHPEHPSTNKKDFDSLVGAAEESQGDF